MQFAIGFNDITLLNGATLNTNYTMAELYDVSASNARLFANGSADIVPIDLYECSRAELGIGDSAEAANSKFFKPFPTDYLNFMDVAPTYLLCFNHDDLYLQGEGSSVEQANL